ncbi:MAG: sigma factor-like helix-turn-helix DNA-binding protein [Actinomycetales bacterium]
MTYTAHARRWDHGWELHVDGVGVTQVRVLEHAKAQVCDLVETMTDSRPAEEHVEVTLDMGDPGTQARNVREMTAQAADLQRRAASASRQVVADLRGAGLSVSDIATVLGVSRGRVSQLLADAPEPTVTVTHRTRPR